MRLTLALLLILLVIAVSLGVREYRRIRREDAIIAQCVDKTMHRHDYPATYIGAVVICTGG